MTKSSLIPVLILTLGIGVACARNDVSGPDVNAPTQQSGPSFTKLEVTPGNIVLAPDGTSQLNVKAWDQFGAAMAVPVDGNGNSELTSRTLFLSSDPRIADVSSNGVVKGISAGNTIIRATLTLNGITRTASTQVAVDGPSGFPAGEYDLTAKITNFDPAWGDLTGYTFTAVLKFPSNGTGGTWENYRLIDAAGVPSDFVNGGIINNYKDFAGRLVSELVSSNFHVVLVSPVTSAVDSRLVTGTFGCCGHIGGTFIARRR